MMPRDEYCSSARFEGVYCMRSKSAMLAYIANHSSKHPFHHLIENLQQLAIDRVRFINEWQE